MHIKQDEKSVPYLLEFEPGQRTLTPPVPPAAAQTDRYFINVSNAVDLIIDGRGTVITFSRYTAYLQLSNCTRVIVENFVFDMNPLLNPFDLQSWRLCLWLKE